MSQEQLEKVSKAVSRTVSLEFSGAGVKRVPGAGVEGAGVAARAGVKGRAGNVEPSQLHADVTNSTFAWA